MAKIIGLLFAYMISQKSGAIFMFINTILWSVSFLNLALNL